jgi:murein DD-endopeptidase MepM/ murein hydrolase activator NlpD
MATDTPRSITFPAAAPDRLTAIDRDGAANGAEREQLGELAAQFESMLMLEMIKQMRKSLLDEQAEGEGLGNETYSSTIDSELAMHLARAGGLGLTPMMVDAWERQQQAVRPGTPLARPDGISVSPANAAAAAPTMTPQKVSVNRPVAVAALAATPSSSSGREQQESALSLEMSGRVSSAYGWRSDPLKGHAKFHGGIDLAARYGTEVPAAAAGTVVSAGEQGGYGLTVVVRHQNGFESRYAHLASLDVRAGDRVTQGQQVGRVGSTGRSTGPHLHFEVMQGGRRIDPERFVRNLTSDIKGQ